MPLEKDDSSELSDIVTDNVSLTWHVCLQDDGSVLFPWPTSHDASAYPVHAPTAVVRKMYLGSALEWCPVPLSGVKMTKIMKSCDSHSLQVWEGNDTILIYSPCGSPRSEKP